MCRILGKIWFYSRKNFRCNSLLAVPQETNVHPVLNVSSSKGRSMNDNIDLQCLETVRMTSAKSFGYSIYEAGRGAIMSKLDIVAAYKQKQNLKIAA